MSSKYLSKQGEGIIIPGSYGTYVIGSADLVDKDKWSVGTSFCVPDKAHTTHVHEEDDEIIYFMNGKGEQVVGDEEFMVEEGDMAFIPAGVNHSFTNKCVNPVRMMIIKVRAK